MNELFYVAGQKDLQYVDLSANEFTGTLPLDLFTAPYIQTVAMVQNCIQGSISDSICDAELLSVLALDGLATSTKCQQSIFNIRPIVTYVLQFYLEGSLPKCLFQMPKLQVVDVVD